MAKITTYFTVFEQRLKKLRSSIKEEINKPKRDRNKRTLKGWLREANDLKRTLRNIKPAETEIKFCPHCHEKL